jgi:hypothetical protein
MLRKRRGTYMAPRNSQEFRPRVNSRGLSPNDRAGWPDAGSDKKRVFLQEIPHLVYEARSTINEAAKARKTGTRALSPCTKHSPCGAEVQEAAPTCPP